MSDLILVCLFAVTLLTGGFYHLNNDAKELQTKIVTQSKRIKELENQVKEYKEWIG